MISHFVIGHEGTIKCYKTQKKNRFSLFPFSGHVGANCVVLNNRFKNMTFRNLEIAILYILQKNISYIITIQFIYGPTSCFKCFKGVEQIFRYENIPKHQHVISNVKDHFTFQHLYITMSKTRGEPPQQFHVLIKKKMLNDAQYSTKNNNKGCRSKLCSLKIFIYIVVYVKRYPEGKGYYVAKMK